MTVEELRTALAGLPGELEVVAIDGLTPLDVGPLMNAEQLIRNSVSLGCPAAAVAQLQRCLAADEVYLTLTHFG
jgi:hypothetical protein